MRDRAASRDTSDMNAAPFMGAMFQSSRITPGGRLDRRYSRPLLPSRASAVPIPSTISRSWIASRMSLSSSMTRTSLLGGTAALRRREREVEGEGRAAFQLALELDGAARRLHDVAADPETQTESPV